MRGMKLDHVAVTTAMAIALAGCTTSLAPTARTAPAIAFDRQAVLAEMAHPATSDWSDSRLTSVEVDRLRIQPVAADKRRSEAKAMQRKLLALSSAYNASSDGFGGTASTGRISSAPAYSFWTDQGYWITEQGWLLRRTMSSGVTAAFRISSTDTFVKTALTVSNDGLRVYVVSQQGRFYAFDTQTGANISGSPFAMGGTNGNVPNSSMAFIDPFASRDDGQIETVYAVTHTGTLNRFTVNALKTTPATAPTLTHTQAYALPTDNTAPYTELFRSSPVAIGGKIVLGTWRRHSTDPTLDNGRVLYYDTGLAGIPTSATQTTTGSLIRAVGMASPIWAAPAVEFNNSFVPVYAFAPTGYVVSMVDLATGDQAQSVPLLVNQTTPTSGSLANYNYGTSGVVTVTKNAVSGGGVSIADDTSLTLPLSGKWLDNGKFYAAKRYDGDVATPIWAYTRFEVTNADVTVSGAQRAIIDAKVQLKCIESSNANGASNPAPLRSFRVSNHLAGTSTLWDETNITPTNRPAFEDAASFTHSTLKAHESVELLPNAGNSFTKNSNYNWSAKGLVTAPGQFYSFGFAHDDLPYVNTASNNGQPFKASTPQFDGGTNPRLILTLSGQGLETSTMSTPVTIDSLNKRIYAVNTNALYSMSYASATYDGLAEPFVSESLSERKTSFSDVNATYFSLTALGRNTSAGPVSNSVYVANMTAPLFTGTNIYVQDHHGGANATTVNRFTPGLPATLAESFSLTGASADAKRGTPYMSYDYVGSKLYLGSYDPGSTTNGRVWVLNQ